MRMRQPLLFFVHDDERMLAAIWPLVDAAGWRVRAFSSAQECLSALARERPDVLLTELNLPGMDGVQLLKAMDALDYAIPVVAMSDERVMPLSDQAIAAGALEVLCVPFWDEELVETIENAIAARDVFIDALARSVQVHVG